MRTRLSRSPALLDVPGIGPWTASYVAMRALADPDAFLPGDVGLRHALRRLGQDAEGPRATAVAEPWRPWRSYAVMHLWASLAEAARTRLPVRREPARRLMADEADEVAELDVRVD